ncbi:MAG TPA: hypothetical protein VGG39_01830 [Polyangiaceae bacterium]|jgi:hypothetical protein
MTDEKPSSVRFHFIKSAQFRTIHVDGLWGGLTPRGLIHIAFFSERLPIPQQLVQGVNDDGTLGDEILESRVSKEGVVRELEVDAIIDVDIARALHSWLDQQIKTHESLALAASKGGKLP